MARPFIFPKSTQIPKKVLSVDILDRDQVKTKIYLTEIKLRPRCTWRDQDQELQVCTCGKHITEMVYHGTYMITVDFTLILE
jgi:hypothetical protein